MGRGGYIGGSSIIRVGHRIQRKKGGWFEPIDTFHGQKKKRPLVTRKQDKRQNHKIFKKSKLKRPSEDHVAFTSCDQRRLEANLKSLTSQKEEILKQMEIGLISRLDYVQRLRLSRIEQDISILRKAMETK